LYVPYVGALARLAWYQLYFQREPGSATKVLEALHQLLADTDPTMARLDGWNFLVQNNPDAARTKLEAVADRDPLSRLGLIELAEKDNPAPAPSTQPNPMDIDPSHPGEGDLPAPTRDLVTLAS